MLQPNATFIGQIIVFLLLLWFIYAVVVPMIAKPVNERYKRIADGLVAAEAGQKQLEAANVQAKDILREARERARQIEDQAQRISQQTVESAKQEAYAEGARLIAAKQTEAANEVVRARDELRRDYGAPGRASSLTAARAGGRCARACPAARTSDRTGRATLMAERITIARPYARAAFESAHAVGDTLAWSEFLARAAELVRDPALASLIGSPRVLPDQLVELLLELATPSGSSAAARSARSARSARAAQGGSTQRLQAQRNFLALLAHNQRLTLLPEIAARYELLRADAENVANVQVLSARELTSEQSGKLKAALERRLGRTVRLHAQVDAALLGGAIVHYGDYVVDGSLRGRVERLAAAMSGA